LIWKEPFVLKETGGMGTREMKAREMKTRQVKIREVLATRERGHHVPIGGR
jgi:hypothetical protein